MALPTDIVFGLTGDIAGNSRALKQVRLLLEMGYRVEVITFTHPRTLQPLQGNVAVHKLPMPTGRGPLFFARVHRLLKNKANKLPATLYHASDLYALPALSSIAQSHDSLLVYDARERYPYVAATAGRPWVSAFWHFVERSYIHHSSAVFTVSPSIAAHMAASYNISPPKVLFNAPPIQSVTPSAQLRAKADLPPDSIIVLHQGQMRSDRGCIKLVRAMQHVQGAALVFLGDGPLKPTLLQLAQSLNLTEKVRFLPPVPPDALLPLTAEADLGVTLLEDTCLNHRLALPNKLFEYLMAGLPVLGSNLPELRSVIEAQGVGLVVDPSDPGALVTTLQKMVNDKAARTRWSHNTSKVFETFSWEQASQVFKQTYRALLAST